jgi:dienelactone hydrolase
MRRFAILAAIVLPAALAAPADAEVKTRAVEYTVGGVVYEGYMAWDDAAKDKRPGVLVCHEWWGLNDYARSRARQLAEAGYVAFALDMYGKGKVTTDARQAGEWSGALYADAGALRERAGAALAALADDPHTDHRRLAVIGYCMGGTVALELARSGLPHTDHLRAVVCFHTSTIAAKDPSDNARIKGTVLVCHGAADTFVTPEQIAAFHRQMADAGVDYVFVAYSGAVHSFTNPGADAFNIAGVKYDRKADARSWRAMMDLFEERLSAVLR